MKTFSLSLHKNTWPKAESHKVNDTSKNTFQNISRNAPKYVG